MIKITCDFCKSIFSQKSLYNKHIKNCNKVMTDEHNTSYSELSYKLSKSIDKTTIKNNGIYFSPPATIYKNLDALKPYMKNVKTVLEPSCGSCEFVNILHNKYKNINITGIENNTTIYNSIKTFENDKIKLLNQDFLHYDESNNYDLIIGNPPYFVVKKSDVNEKYYDYFDCRPNIFILFIIKSLNHLNKDGILSFILPKNFLNSLYYNKTRQYISQNYKVLNIIDCDDDYIGTKQETVIIIIQNKKPTKTNKYVYNISCYTIFGLAENIISIKKLTNNSKTLSQLGFKVNVGTVVWNQNKSILTDDNTKTLLIYSSDIKDNKLSIQKYSNPEKKNYINKDGINEPLLVVNRGYGKGSYVFNYCLLEGGFDYLIENHLITIRHNSPDNKEDLINMYNKIIKSFENEKTKKFVDLYFGNNAINTTELCEILPIYDI